MIAKVCDRESRRDSWFENRLVLYRKFVERELVVYTLSELVVYTLKQSVGCTELDRINHWIALEIRQKLNRNAFFPTTAAENLIPLGYIFSSES